MDKKSEDLKQDEKVTPLEVTVVNQPKKEVSDYDSKDDVEYDELGITKEQVEEFENDEKT